MIYFISDLHLGTPSLVASLEREKRFVQWLDRVSADAEAIYIMGDLFDFWFEYSSVVPKGYVRTLGKLALLRDAGLPIYFFTGNHDLWMFGYFEQELGIPVYKQPLMCTFNDKTFLIGHGDGLGPKDIGYKLLKKYVFCNPICQWALRCLHPDIGVGIANYFSRRSRQARGRQDDDFRGEDYEWLLQYARRKLETQHIDYFVFGHRHYPLDIALNPTSQYINLGDWLQYYTYAKFDGQQLHLCYDTKK